MSGRDPATCVITTTAQTAHQQEQELEAELVLNMECGHHKENLTVVPSTWPGRPKAENIVYLKHDYKPISSRTPVQPHWIATVNIGHLGTQQQTLDLEESSHMSSRIATLGRPHFLSPGKSRFLHLYIVLHGIVPLSPSQLQHSNSLDNGASLKVP